LSSANLKRQWKINSQPFNKKYRQPGWQHTVELYTRDMYASITPNMRRLRAFQKISLKAGESKTVTFTLDKNDLAFVNEKLKTVTEPGDFEVMIGIRKQHLIISNKKLNY